LHLRLLAQQRAQVTARSCLRNSWTQQRPLRGRKNRLASRDTMVSKWGTLWQPTHDVKIPVMGTIVFSK